MALANVFGTGGGALMARMTGEKREAEARAVVAYSVAMSAITALAFSLLILAFIGPLLRGPGASENTFVYARQYLFATSVLGGVPTVLAMSMPQLLRNAGYAKEAGIAVGLGSLLNVVLDPPFMFVLLPQRKEVLGAGIATMLSNVASVVYLILVYRRVREHTVLVLPTRLPKIGREKKQALYSVGIPAAISIFLFDLVTIVLNRLVASYGDIPLAAMGIVLKLERLPLNIGLGVCLGMVPLIAYNYGAGNYERMRSFFRLARRAVLAVAVLCMVVFWFWADPLVGVFIDDGETVRLGAQFLRTRCLAMPFMLLGYHIVNYMNAVGKGKISFLLAILRHLVLIIPLMLAMNALWGINGLLWSQVIADVINAAVACGVYRQFGRY